MTWVKQLYGLVNKLNDTETQVIWIKPKDAIKLKEVENYLPKHTLPKDGLYCFLLQPGEEHDDQCKRAINRIWSKKTHRLNKVVLILEDTELPPDNVQKW